RVGWFRPVELLGGQQGVGQRRAAQRQDEVQPWPATGTADGHRGVHAALPKTGRPSRAHPVALGGPLPIRQEEERIKRGSWAVGQAGEARAVGAASPHGVSAAGRGRDGWQLGTEQKPTGAYELASDVPQGNAPYERVDRPTRRVPSRWG